MEIGSFFLTNIVNSNKQYTTEILDVEQALEHVIIDEHATFKKVRVKDMSNPWFKGQNLGFSKAYCEGAHRLTFR